MVKVLVYGCSTGVFSNFPKNRTLCDFRALHLKELAALFVQVVKLAGECGLVKLGIIAVDGTKLRANASRHKAMSYERMQAVVPIAVTVCSGHVRRNQRSRCRNPCGHAAVFFHHAHSAFAHFGGKASSIPGAIQHPRTAAVRVVFRNSEHRLGSEGLFLCSARRVLVT